MARKILLADDSVTAQNMGRKILADAGYEIIAVNNGSAALKKIAELKPDLVILDVYMPGYSGLEVCQRLKDSPETSRIPVLLTVGKLEPFKPDEAQRVRAEGYIVKPFEASELLSALSKLEDKVVPRSEPSKPGRFARATAAAEESGSGSRSESSTGDNGWKSRISFPHKKTEPEEKVADESSTYNPVNRDLRTVVETAEEKAEYKNQHAAPEAETRADAEATASAGAPRDVTPEEIAAMTAAAAQMQMASAATNEEQRASETASQAGPEPATAALNAEVRTAAAEDSKGGKVEESVAAFAAVAMDDRHNGGKKPEETEQAQDGPMTMAAAVDSVSTESVGGSRWTAVLVALETEENSLSLDREMQKAYAAAEPDSALATTPETNTVLSETTSASAESVVEPKAPISNSESEATAQPESSTIIAASEAEARPVVQLEHAADNSFFAAAETTRPEESANASSQIEIPNVAPAMAEDGGDGAPFEAPAQSSATAEFATPSQAPVAESESPAFASSASQTEVASAYSDGARELPSAPVAESAEAAATNSASDSALRDPQRDVEQATESKVDHEGVKSTAAAWASWRQIRDTGKSNEVGQGQSGEFEVPEPASPDTNAMAVAAGAEQILQPAAVAEQTNSPADVASIVDSVLAGLRPKLMEEISRKMAEKK